jgi:hypothetical protein
VTVSLTDLPAGHVFPTASFTIDAEAVRAYCAATGDSLALYAEAAIVPPLAAAALCLGALLKDVSLPSGTLHANESVDVAAPVPVDAGLDCCTTLVQRSQRSGWVVSVIESVLYAGDEAALTTRATVLSPAAP